MTQHLKKPLYGNCLITAPDGKPLCRTNQKKLNWYLSRGLAVVVEGAECPTIRLNFEPSGRKGSDHPYLIAEKQNRCVCCASEEQITRHHVVPYGFRKFFPIELKEHMLHDILPLCVNCHEKYEGTAFELKKELAKRHNISLLGKGCHTDKSLYSIRGAGNALYYHSDKMPAARREVLLNKLRAYYNKQDISREEMLKAAKVDPMVQTPEYIPFGKYIVDQYACDMFGFMVMWRQHFVDHMQPQYLPDFWDVHHQLEA
jgi:hypothetical protein